MHVPECNWQARYSVPRDRQELERGHVSDALGNGDDFVLADVQDLEFVELDELCKSQPSMAPSRRSFYAADIPARETRSTGSIVD